MAARFSPRPQNGVFGLRTPTVRFILGKEASTKRIFPVCKLEDRLWMPTCCLKRGFEAFTLAEGKKFPRAGG